MPLQHGVLLDLGNCLKGSPSSILSKRLGHFLALGSGMLLYLFYVGQGLDQHAC